MEKNFDEALDTFLKKCTQKTSHSLRVEPLKRYVRVAWGESAFCFIEKATGDVLKPSTWSVPAKHARGNIFDPDGGMENVCVNGIKNLKTGRKPRT